MTLATSHVVYGGAHLFSERTPQKLAELASAAFDQYYRHESSENLGDSRVHTLVREKLKTRAVESIRIDFEDGFGTRTDAEEDEHAERTANELAKIVTSETRSTTTFGLRVRAWNDQTSRRAARTLDVFYTHLSHALAEKMGQNAQNAGAAGSAVDTVVCLPKVTSPKEVEAFVLELRSLEARLSFTPIGIELMAETKESASRTALRSFIDAGEGRVRSIHLGAYDFLSELEVPARAQKLHHPYTDELRLKMLLATAGTNVAVFDGATTTLPIDAKSKDGRPLTEAQIAENHARVVAALVMHASDVTQSLDKGFFANWILYPAQLVSHAIATQTYYLEELERSRARLENFAQKAARATSLGAAFDDRATARGLVSFFARGLAGGWLKSSDLGALLPHEAHLLAGDIDALARAVRPAQ